MTRGTTGSALPVIGDIRAWDDPSLVALRRLSTGTVRHAAASPALSLDGTWQFMLFERPDDVPAEIIGSGDALASCLPAEDWREVAVPGNWTMQGVEDIPHYTNIQMPFEGPPPHLPSRNPTGVYRRSFEVPADWGDTQTVLSIGGADSVHGVYVNGHFVGYGTDARLASEYDVSRVVVPGGNDIAIVVVRYSAHSYIEDQDAWWMPGLHRSVFIESRPPVRLADVVIDADWDCEESTGSLRVVAEVGFGEHVRSGYRTRLSLDGASGHRVLTDVESDVAYVHAEPYVFTGFTSRSELPGLPVAPWSAEAPVLYTCVIELLDAQGHIVDRAVQRVGFRHVEIRGEDLLVNGQRVWIHGVNRHDHHPDRGTAVTIEDMRADLIQMRRHNITAIRTSHYPNAPEFYDLCDELGFYVIDEANIESHAYNWFLCDEPSYRQAWVERVGRMVQRDRNHPSIIMWSLGNESGYGANHDAAAAWVRRVDPNRPLHYEDAIRIQGWTDGGRLATDVVCPMYPSIGEIRAYGELVAAGGADRPLIMCEYSHAMGNANGSLADYWDVIRSLPGLQGGFIWEWKDQTLRMTLEDGSPRLAYGGMFGDAPHDYNFVADGLVDADLVPHPALAEVAWVYRPVETKFEIDRLTIQNRRSFLTLSDLVATWTLLRHGEMVSSGELIVPTIVPGTEISIAFPVALPTEGELVFTVTWATREDTWYALAGHVVAVDQSVLRAVLPESAALEISSTPASHEVPNDAVLHGPELALWRAAVDNDGFKLFPDVAKAENKGSMTLFRWEAQGVDTRPASQLAQEEHETVPIEGGAFHRHSVTVPETLKDLPRVGVRYQVAGRFDRLRWYGRGPGENYPDRKRGSMLGLWEAAIEECPYVVPQEYGLRTDVRWFELIDSSTGEKVRVDAFDAPIHVSAIRHTAEALHAASHAGDLVEDERITVSIDIAHRGVGNHACGPEVLEKYRIPAGQHVLAYSVAVMQSPRPRSGETVRRHP